MTDGVGDKRRQTWRVNPRGGGIVAIVEKANAGGCLTLDEIAALLGTGRATIHAAELSALKKLRLAMCEHTVPERTSCLPPKEFEIDEVWVDRGGGPRYGDMCDKGAEGLW